MSPKKSADARIEVEERLFPAQAVQAAAYAFTDRAYARVESAGEGRLLVALSPKDEKTSAAALEGEFRNELLHQALRLKVSTANRKIREFIVTKALVSAQPASALAQGVPAHDDACPDCAQPAAALPLDPELEKEIDRLLAEVEGGDQAADPLGVSVTWEEKFGGGAGEKTA